jgi:ATP-dependent DNA helicase RecG
MQNSSARERLTVLKNKNDGFAVAEADLRLRGPGDFFGSRQHGLPEFRIADLSNDTEILSASQEAAETLFPELHEHAALKAAVGALLHRIEGGD